MSQSTASPDHLEVAQTRSHALLAHQHFAGVQLRGIAGLAAATVATAPIVIEDLNGEPLYHDYPLTSGGAVVGTIRCAANKKLGSPVISVSHAAPGWSPDAALRMATEALHKQHPNARVVASQLVCYANPKIGIRLHFELTPGGASESAIFDASSGQPVGQTTDPANQFTAYSLLSSLPAAEIASRRAQFLASEQQIATVAPAHAATTASPTLPLPPPHLLVRQGLVQLSPYCPGSGPGNSHYAQITDYFCVDASAQMLMEHYGWNYTQNQIAIAMDTTAAQGGTTGAGLTSGFASLTHNSLTLTFDNNASRAQQFQDAVTEVSANRPLFTQVPHHYRVCMGYQESLLVPIWSALGLGQMLYIFDPWPWNPDLCKPGAAYWESWATSPVMWFGIVHHA
ncbi:MAG TPA: C39 family peptidase [Acetobacteraceae bacterium]|nr:C39 family peptidase [Acetobacteraceae bacterium]